MFDATFMYLRIKSIHFVSSTWMSIFRLILMSSTWSLEHVALECSFLADGRSGDLETYIPA